MNAPPLNSASRSSVEGAAGAADPHPSGAPAAAGTTTWRVQALAALVCLAALGAAWVLDGRFHPAAVGLYALSYAAGMWFAAREAAWNLARGQVDVDFLMILVAIGAWALGEPTEGALLLVLFGGSRAMEAFANERTRSAVQALIQDAPTTARRRRGGAGGPEETVSVAEIAPGDRLVVRPGERFPLDARIEAGHTVVNASAITGETYPWEVGPGVEVPSGAINETGLVEATALRPAAESAYQKIIRLIEDAPQRRAPAQVLSERIGRLYTRAILAVSIGALAVWWMVMAIPFHEAMYRAMALLVAGSPCALVLSLPSAVLAGIAAGARRGVLFHGGRGLLGAGSVTAVVFDKTGTLTFGEPEVEAVWYFPAAGGTPLLLSEPLLAADGAGGTMPPDVLECCSAAAALAEASTHPAARAVVQWAARRSVAPAAGVSGIREVHGVGIEGEWNGHSVQLGRMEKDPTIGGGGTAPADSDDPADRQPRDGRRFPDGPRTALCVEGRPRIVFFLREATRPDAAQTVRGLLDRGLRLMVLSGDAPAPVERLARALGIADARAGLRPGDKSTIVRELSAAGEVVMMTGDGVNDAPALAAADVGVAMGLRGSAAALEQADVVLQKDELPALLAAIDLGRRARRIVAQNIAIAVGMAAVLVSVALAGRLLLVLGVLGHEGGTVLVVLNSLRLLAASGDSGGTREPADSNV
ncbi:MAG: hypothetical protein Kow0059_22870 [Candidatus Sumerlaeia bacterium]